VKAHIKGNELRAWPALIEKVLNGHFDANLYGRGAIVRVKNPVLSVGKMANQSLRQLYGRRVGKAGEDDMFQLQQLLMHFFCDIGMSMAVQIHPPGSHTVNVGPSLLIVQQRPFRFHNRQRWGSRFHLCVRMPDMPGIAFR
jgi:hypothetical protein